MSIRVKFGDPPHVYPPMDPNDKLDFSIDWSTFLGADTISSSDWNVTGLTSSSPTAGSQSTTVWLEAGSPGQKATVRNRIVTAAGRTKDLTFQIPIAEN